MWLRHRLFRQKESLLASSCHHLASCHLILTVILGGCHCAHFTCEETEAYSHWPNLLVTQDTWATPLPDCPAGTISQHTHTHAVILPTRHPKTRAHLSRVCVRTGHERSQNAQRRAGTSDGPPASQQGGRALGVTDPLTQGIPGPSRWQGQGWQCLMPTRATLQVSLRDPGPRPQWNAHVSVYLLFKGFKN